MVISRLFITNIRLQLKNRGTHISSNFNPAIHFYSQPLLTIVKLHCRHHEFVAGFPKLQRCFCSRTPPLPPDKLSKKSEALKDEPTEIIRSLFDRFMLEHPAISPKTKEQHEKVGRSCIQKDILTEINTKLLPTNSQFDKQNVVEATFETNLAETNSDITTLHRPDNAFLDSGEILDVEKSYVTEVTNSEALKFSDNTKHAEPKQVEQMREILNIEHVDSQTAATVGKSDRAEKTFAFLDVLLDMEKPLVTEVNNSEFFRISNSAELVEPAPLKEMLVADNYHAMEVEDSNDPSFVKILGGPDEGFEVFSETGTKKLHATDVKDSRHPSSLNIRVTAKRAVPRQTGHLIEMLDMEKSLQSHDVGEEISRTSIPDVSKINITNTTSSGHGDNQSLSPNIKFSPTEIAASAKVTNMFGYFERETEEGKSNGTKNNSLKNGTCSNLKEMVDIFRKHQTDLGDKLTLKKKLEQDGALDYEEMSGNDLEKSGVRGFYQHLMSEVSQKTDSRTVTPSSEATSFVNGIINQLCLNGKHASRDQKLERNKETLVAKDHRLEEGQPGTREIERMIVCLENNHMAVNSSDENDSTVAAFGYSKPEPRIKIPLPFEGPHLSASENAQICSPKHLLLVKFLPKTAMVNDISVAFGDCGPISGIRIVNSRKGNKFNCAYISFETVKGLRKALRKEGTSICDADVVVEALCASKMGNKTIHVGKVENEHFPMGFIKNPSRTVMVKGLPESLSFCLLRDALSSWGHVSSIAMGSLPSMAYVEFKSEETKERVLAEATVSVLGEKLQILRVEAPKTTVVRISNLSPFSKLENVLDICASCGQVKKVVNRDVDVIDVHYAFSEWTNIVEILNSLNGLVVDQYKWLAQPATVIPTEVLQALWNEPGGRRHIHIMIQSICKRIEENSINAADLLGLAREYYGESPDEFEEIVIK